MEEEEELRRRKLEEALEVKSLRRIIAIQRLRRKISEDMNDILESFPYHTRCIAQNSYFIFEMLKAFEPPLDLSQEVDMSEDHYKDNISGNRPLSGESGETSLFTSQSGSKSGRRHIDMADKEVIVGVNRTPKSETCNEETQIEYLNKNDGKCCIGSEHNGEAETAAVNGSRSTNFSQVSSNPCCDELVRSIISINTSREVGGMKGKKITLGGKV